MSVLELFELNQNYEMLNLSTTEIILQIQKVLTYPIYLWLMSLFSCIIMFYFYINDSNTI